MAGGVIGALRVTLGMNSAEFEAGARRAQAEAQVAARGIAGSFERMRVEVNTAFEGIKHSAELLGLALTAEMFAEFAKGALEFAAGLGETSQRIGVTVEQLQALNRAARATETSQEGMQRALAIFNRRLGEAQAGLPQTVRIFQQLGFTRAQLMSYQNGGEMLGAVFDRLNRFRTGAESAAAGQRLFGRGFSEIIPMVREGSEGLEHWTSVARESGMVTAEQARVAHEAMVELGQLAITIRTGLAQAVIGILPLLRGLVDDLRSVGSMASWAFGMMSRVTGVNVGAVAGGAAMDTAQNFLNPLHAVRSIYDRYQNLMNPQPRQAGNFWSSIAHGPHGPARGDTDLDLTHGGGGGRGGGGGNGDAERNRAIRDEHQFQSDLRREQIAQLQASQQQTRDELVRNDLAQQILDLEEQQYRGDIEMRVALDHLNEAKAAQLVAAHHATVVEQHHTLSLEHSRLLRDEENDLSEQRFQLATAALQDQAALADTAEERRRVELEILNLSYRYQRAKLQEVIDAESTDPHQRARAQAEQRALDAGHGNQVTAAQRNTRGPLEEYLSTLPHTAAMAREALQSVAADGLGAITEGLTAAITGTQKWGDMFKQVAMKIIADLLKIQIEQQLVGLFSSLFPSLAPARAGVSSIGSAVASAVGGLGRRAAGGPVLPGRSYVVGERGPELLHMGGAGTIVPNDQMGGGAHIIIELRDDMLDARIISGSVQVMRAGAPQLIQAGKSATIRDLGRSRL